MELQVTLLSDKYKPVSTIVPMPMKEVAVKNFKPYKEQGIIKICQKRNWNYDDLKRYGYVKIKTRVFDAKKIKEESEKRYEEIKKENFANGKWKPSKKDIEKGLATIDTKI